MPAPLKYADLSTILGSWSTVQEFISGVTSVDPRAIDLEPTILGVSKKDTYDVGGKDIEISFGLSGGGGDSLTVTFSAPGPLTLEEVITDINTEFGGQPWATNDNGFLRLTNVMNGAYLRLDASGDPDAYYELGLFVGTEAVAGQLTQTQHFDPDRQVALPGQLSLGDGEDFKANAINRALHQLATNTDFNQAVTARKRVPLVQETDNLAFLNDVGLDLTTLGAGFVYTGPDIAPNEDELESLFKFVDGEGREVLWKDIGDPVDTNRAAGVPDILQDPDTGEWWVSTTQPYWTTNDPKDGTHIVMSSLALNPGINGVPLKVVSWIDASTVVIDPQDFSLVAENAGVAERVLVEYKKLRVSEVRKGPGGAPPDTDRVEKLEESILGGVPESVTRVDKGNRIVCAGASFSEAEEGDWYGYKVNWTGHTGAEPYGNDGTYRVSRVLDKNTIEVVGDDFGPVVLNPAEGTDFGDIDITSDGNFWKNPYLKFVDGAEVTGKTFRLRYYKAGTLEEATDDPFNMIGNNLDYGIKGDLSIQKAILSILGPSVSSINEYIYDDRRITLEDLNNRLVDEHYDHDTVGPDAKAGHGGRHKDIRPDHINMWLIDGETVTVRGTSADADDVTKLAVRDSADLVRFSVSPSGIVESRYEAGGNSSVASLFTAEDEAILQAAAKTTTGKAQVNLLSGIDQGDPVWFSIRSQYNTDSLIVRVENDGTGSSREAARFDVSGILELTKAASGDALIGGAGPGNTSWGLAFDSGGTVTLSARKGGGDMSVAAGPNGTSGTVGGYAELVGGTGGSTAIGGEARVTGGTGGSGAIGGALFLYAGDTGGGTDLDGATAELGSGQTTGDGSSDAVLKATTAGQGAGTDVRDPEPYLKCDGATGSVTAIKPLSVKDAGFYLDFDGTDPFINFDTNDTIQFDRDGGANANGQYIFDVNSVAQLVIEEESVIVKAASSLILEPRLESGLAQNDGLAIAHATSHKLQIYPNHGGSSWEHYIPQCRSLENDENAGGPTGTVPFNSSIYSIYPNTLREGSTIRVRAAGNIIDATGITSFRVYFSGHGAAQGLNFPVTGIGAGDFIIEAFFTLYGPLGGSGEMTRAGTFTHNAGVTPQPTIALQGISSTSFNSAAPQNVTVAFDTGSALSNVTLYQMIVDVAK